MPIRTRKASITRAIINFTIYATFDEKDNFIGCHIFIKVYNKMKQTKTQ